MWPSAILYTSAFMASSSSSTRAPTAQQTTLIFICQLQHQIRVKQPMMTRCRLSVASRSDPNMEEPTKAPTTA